MARRTKKKFEADKLKIKNLLELRKKKAAFKNKFAQTQLQKTGTYSTDLPPSVNVTASQLLLTSKNIFNEVPASSSNINTTEKIGPIENEPTALNVYGRRMLALPSLVLCIERISQHAKCCPEFELKYDYESRSGLDSDIYFKCACSWKVCVSSNSGKESLPVNKSFVWGTLIAPIGYDAARSFLTVHDIPVPSETLYLKDRSICKDQLFSVSAAMMQEAAAEERRLSIECNEFAVVDGVQYPCTTVLVDGGWSKRSYGHGFDSNCGLAVIIGARTGKVLYMDTRVKTCYICSVAKNKGTKPALHECYSNWTSKSTAMEADIIKKGFEESIKEFNLVYGRFVGDGDSSVHAAVEKVYPGYTVEKVECKNHIMKNLNKKLMNIAKDEIPGRNAVRIPLSERKIPGMAEKFARIGQGIAGAIIHHNKLQKNSVTQHELLQQDILNVPQHVFGNHQNCELYFCAIDSDRRKEANQVPEYELLNFWRPMMTAVEKVASVSSSLIKCMTTNAVESFMAVAAKYAEGKRKSLGKSYLYALRMKCAVMAYNDTSFWAASVYRRVFDKSPSALWDKCHLIYQKRKLKNKKKPKRLERGRPSFGLQRNVGDIHYGKCPARPELKGRPLRLAIERLRRRLQVNAVQQKALEEATLLQKDSKLWGEQRTERMTASNCGKVKKFGKHTDNTSILNLLLHPVVYSKIPESILYGQLNEKIAIAQYMKEKNLNDFDVKPAGLVVSIENGIFAASPDLYVGKDGILEIKCPYSSQNDDPNLWPVTRPKTSYLEVVDGKTRLKRDHNYFHQVCMQLFVTKKQWCDFYVWTPVKSFCERIMWNQETEKKWNETKGPLEKFWLEELAPEIVDSQYEQGKEYRCPASRKVARDKRNQGNKKRKL